MNHGIYDGLYTINDKNGDIEIKKFYINGNLGYEVNLSIQSKAKFKPLTYK